MQSASVFSEGPAERTIRRHSIGSSGSGSGLKSNARDSGRPVQKTAVKVENCKEETTDVGGIVHLMDTCENVFSGPVEMVPVQLPLINSNSSSARHDRSVDRVAASATAVHSTLNGIVKQEPMEIDKEVDIPVSHFSKQNSGCTTTVADVFSERPCSQLVFMQFPNCICTALESKDDSAKEHDSQLRTSLAAAPSGYAGQVRVHKSGRVSMQLGNTVLDLTEGVESGILQQVVSIHPEEDDRYLSVLGTVRQRLICNPDLEQLLDSK